MIDRQDVHKMRMMYANGESISTIANLYGYKVRSVRNAVSGKTFRDLPDPQDVSSGKNNTLREQQIADEIARIGHHRGNVKMIMQKYNITYETYRRLRGDYND